MAITSNSYTGNGSTTLYSFTFPYLDESHVKITLNGTLTTAYTFANATTIQFNTAPGAGVAIRIYRETNNDQTEATFFAGSSIKAQDLNNNFTQTLYTVQEVVDRYLSKVGDTMQGILNMGGFKITNLGAPTSGTDATTKTYVDTQDALKVNKAGDTMSGNLAMGGNKVTGLGSPSGSADAATKSYVDGYINTTYLGPSATDPTTRPGGAPLQVGDQYFNTNQNILKAWTGTVWVISAAAGSIVRWRKTASAGNTTLSGVDDLGITLSYVVGNEQVFLNGALQIRGVDYTAATGTSITFTPALLAGDVVELHAVQGYVSATVPDGSVGETKLANGAVTSAKIADGTIVNADVNASAGIVASKLSFTQAGAGATARTVDSKLKDVVSVKDFGAVGDGVANDYNAFVLAAQAIQANGGGCLVIPFSAAGYLITCPTNNGAVCSFSNLSNLAIRGDAAYIRFGNTYASSEGNTLFQFDTCSNVSVTDIRVYNNYTKTVVQSGVRVLYFLNQCTGVSVDDVELNGGLAVIQVYKNPALGASQQARGFSIGRVKASNAWYGINCQFNGDHFSVANLETDGIHRSYFIYGVKHHKAFIRSRNNAAEDVAIGSVDGFGCEGIDIDYTNTDSVAPASGNLGACVDIGLNGTTPAVMRNIKVRITATVAPNTIGYGVAISSADATAPGHVCENVEISGSITSTWATFNPVHIGYVYPATGNNFIRNIRIKDLFVGGSVANSYINCRNISYLKLENATFAGGCIIYNGAAGSKVLVENCEATTFSDNIADSTAVQFVNTHITTGTNQGSVNKTFINSLLASERPNQLPVAWCAINPDGTLRRGVGVASTSKISTGSYAVNLSSAYSVSNFAVLATANYGGATSAFCEAIQWSSTQVRANVVNSAGTAVDPANEVMVAVFANPNY